MELLTMKNRLYSNIALIAAISACAISGPAAARSVASDSQIAASFLSETQTLTVLADGKAQQSRDVRLPARGSTGVDFGNPPAPLPAPRFPAQSLPQPVPQSFPSSLPPSLPQPLPNAQIPSQQFPDASLPNGGFPEDDFNGADFRNQSIDDGDIYERCRRDNGLGGALIGGAIGGLAGNRIAGRGNRTEGTLIGAGVGAVAGALIDKAERDPCDQFRQPQRQSYGDYASYYAAYNQWLNNYYAAYAQQYNAYAQAVANAQAGATTTVTVTGGCGCNQTEYVTEEVYQRQPVRRIKRTDDKRLLRSKLRPASR